MDEITQDTQAQASATAPAVAIPESTAPAIPLAADAPPPVVDQAPAGAVDTQADDESVAQSIGAQIARARNALQHMEEAIAREVHAALGEIESLLGMKD